MSSQYVFFLPKFWAVVLIRHTSDEQITTSRGKQRNLFEFDLNVRTVLVGFTILQLTHYIVRVTYHCQ